MITPPLGRQCVTVCPLLCRVDAAAFATAATLYIYDGESSPWTPPSPPGPTLVSQLLPIDTGSFLDLDEVLGAVVIGVGINAFFYGFSVLQFVQYRTRLFRDGHLTQLLVTWTFLIDTTHTVALCWLLWSYIVDNFTNPSYLTSAPWPFTTTPLFLAVTAAPIQVYFADRVRTLSKSRVLCGIILLFSLANTAMGVVATVFAFTHASVQDFNLILPIVDTWLVTAFLCDGLTSVCLVYYLTRSRSGFRRHQSFRNRVAHAFIESSVLTSVFALADIVVYSTVPNTNYHIIIGFPMGRVYTCTLLAMLNARLKLREDEADGVVSKESQNQSYERRLDFANAFNKLKRSPPQVQVSVAVQERVDVVLDSHRKSMSRTMSNGGAYTPPSHDSGDLDHKRPDSFVA
ncbi:hypothetical protein C8Q74DRAFT_715248 [Fomes fomentarius]|nr:hypothetical protein C8Q74DRAFT_715248 [Fomes fomentarius]